VLHFNGPFLTRRPEVFQRAPLRLRKGPGPRYVDSPFLKRRRDVGASVLKPVVLAGSTIRYPWSAFLYRYRGAAFRVFPSQLPFIQEVVGATSRLNRSVGMRRRNVPRLPNIWNQSAEDVKGSDVPWNQPVSWATKSLEASTKHQKQRIFNRRTLYRVPYEDVDPGAVPWTQSVSGTRAQRLALDLRQRSALRATPLIERPAYEDVDPRAVPWIQPVRGRNPLLSNHWISSWYQNPGDFVAVVVEPDTYTPSPRQAKLLRGLPRVFSLLFHDSADDVNTNDVPWIQDVQGTEAERRALAAFRRLGTISQQSLWEQSSDDINPNDVPWIQPVRGKIREDLRRIYSLLFAESERDVDANDVPWTAPVLYKLEQPLNRRWIANWFFGSADEFVTPPEPELYIPGPQRRILKTRFPVLVSLLLSRDVEGVDTNDVPWIAPVRGRIREDFKRQYPLIFNPSDQDVDANDVPWIQPVRGRIEENLPRMFSLLFRQSDDDVSFDDVPWSAPVIARPTRRPQRQWIYYLIQGTNDFVAAPVEVDTYTCSVLGIRKYSKPGRPVGLIYYVSNPNDVPAVVVVTRHLNLPLTGAG